MNYYLDCDVCGDPVTLDAARYRHFTDAQTKPRCATCRNYSGMVTLETEIMKTKDVVSPNQKIARLAVLYSQAGDALYERAGIVAALMKDKDWILAEHNGIYDKAEKAIQDDYFGDICGTTFTLGQLICVFENFKLEVWRKHKFNVMDLYAEYEVRRKSLRKQIVQSPKRATLQDLEDREQKMKEKDFVIKQQAAEIVAIAKAAEQSRQATDEAKQIVAQVRKTNAQLEEENRQLRDENEGLRRKIAELESVLESQNVAALAG